MSGFHPAFPCDKQDPMVLERKWDGLTKREYAAIQICAGMRAMPLPDDWDRNDIATYAVAQADALFVALEEMKR